MSVPKEIERLVDRFDPSSQMNETQVRREFIDPFFKALGWDIANEQGAADAYKDVIHEDAIKVGGATKAPDYCFRIGGTRKFFVEAKKPSIDLQNEPSAAYQLRRYAWSAKLPLGILTDFEEFAVYDCRKRPAKSDKPSHSRILYFTYDQYIDKWDEIAGIFSRDAVVKGSFDKYAESHKKKGTEEVDDAFLKEIEKWRELLAKNIALRNSELSQREINFAVQRTIDRIIFLRICEDRSIEDYNHLMGLTNGSNVYKRLREYFYRADERYNSGLFHFEKEKDRPDFDALTPKLNIDDATLKKIIGGLYYPDSPYEFSILPASILGQVYEQFLGKVIYLTKGHHAKIEDKPEVKKAGGVYYTPEYIVDYIVDNTLGKMLGGKTPKQVEKIKVLDPACGSGSFLINAYQKLIDWHRDYYLNSDKPKERKLVYEGPGGVWYLSTPEKKRILLNNIFGVDIDSQAVEVTKLSLLLKVLEGETDQTINAQMKLFHASRALPDLGDNIKCGNSLIGPDFYEGRLKGILDDEEARRINVFDWNAEFSDIVKSGGFNVVIGNPPWISLSGKFGASIYSEEEIQYMIKCFRGNTYMPNMYEYFVALGMDRVHSDGYFSFIVPDRLGFNDQFVNLRKRILSEMLILKLTYKVPFPRITADCMIFVLEKSKCREDHMVPISEYQMPPIERSQNDLLSQPTFKFEYFEDPGIMHLTEKIENNAKCIRLCAAADITSGFGGRSKAITSERNSNVQIFVLKGSSIDRYHVGEGYWFDFKRTNITGRTTDKSKLGANPKILLRKTGDRLLCAYDDTGTFPEQSLYFLFNNKSSAGFEYILGLLNSKLMTFYYRARALTNKKSIAQVKKTDLDMLPIVSLNRSDPAEKGYIDQMKQYVEQMIVLNSKLRNSRIQGDKNSIQRQLDATDKQIDKLVYELYGLTEEEIKIVEEI